MPDGITLDYLAVQASVQFDGTGSGKAILSPGAGQFWLPTIAHVGTATLTGNGANCSLHVGAQKVVDYTTQVDFTFSGVSDSSTVVSGMIVSPGESITAYFNNGTPFDTGYLRVIGVSSSAPPTVGLDPGFPGAKFTGNESTVTISGQPIAVDVVNQPTVDIADSNGAAINVKQLYPNSWVFVNNTIAAGATIVYVPAATGQQLYLHTVKLDFNTAAQQNIHVNGQDTTPRTFMSAFQTYIGAASANWSPPNAAVDYKGLPLSSGAGIQLVNNSAVSVLVTGAITYSI